MEKRSKAFDGVIILTVTMLLVKILSAVYRVPYQNILGDAGLYAYQQVYPIAAIVSVLGLNAIPSVISQSDFRKETVQYLYRIVNIICVVSFLSVQLFGEHIAMLMGDAHLTHMLKVSAWTLLCLPFTSFVRGRLQRDGDMKSIACSQLIDQTVRVGIILAAIACFAFIHLTIYDAGAVAIAGSFFGILSASLYFFFFRKFRIYSKARTVDTKALKHFMTLTLFYSMSYLVMILWQLVDSFTVINMLKTSGFTINESRNLKGIYDRGASLIQMGLIVTTSFSLVLIPLLSESRGNGNIRQMNDYARSALKITMIFSSAAAVGLMNLIQPFNVFLFKSSHGSDALLLYMPAIIFVSLIIMYTAMLQIFQLYKPQVIALLSGITVKVILNIILVYYFDIKGASISTVIALFIYTALLHRAVSRVYRLEFMSFILRWGATLLVMTLCIQIMMLIPYDSRLSALFVSLVGVLTGVVIVLYAMIKLKLISIHEWSFLPFGDYMIKMMKE